MSQAEKWIILLLYIAQCALILALFAVIFMQVLGIADASIVQIASAIAGVAACDKLIKKKARQ